MNAPFKKPTQVRSVLLDTTDHSDAILCGYDGPRDYREDGEGLQVTHGVFDRFESVTFNGPDGEVSLSGRSEIEQVWKALGRVLWKEAA